MQLMRLFLCFSDEILHILRSALANDSTGNLISRISGRLGDKIIRSVMNHHTAPKDVTDPKTIRHHTHSCTSTAAQQRRKVTCMGWMFPFDGVIVRTGFRKTRIGTISVFMDMKTEKVGFRFRKSSDLRGHQHPSPAGFKPYDSTQFRMQIVSFDTRNS